MFLSVFSITLHSRGAACPDYGKIDPLMKSLSVTIASLALLSILYGCVQSGPSHVSPYGWPVTDTEYDSLTLEAERLYIDRQADSLWPVLDRMKEISAEHPADRRMAIRTAYWEGRMRFTTGDIEGAKRFLEKTLQMTDSARHPYEYHRIQWNLDMDYHPSDIGQYNWLLQEYQFFSDAGDLMMAADYAMKLGTFLNNVGDIENGIPYLHTADSLLLLAGQPEQVANNRINHADALRIVGDSIGAERMYRRMLADTVNPVTPYARDIILGNLYATCGDTAALREAYDLVKNNPLLIDAKCMYENFLTEEALRVDNLPLARHYHSLAGQSIPEIEDTRTLVEYYRLRYNIFQREGRMDSAYHYLHKAAGISEEINTSDRELQIRNANLMAKIAERRLQADLERRRNTIIQLSISFALLLALIAGGVVAYRRMQRQKLEQVKASLKLERSNRRLMAMELLMKEKENLFQTVGEDMKELSQQGEISTHAANKIASSLKAHSSTKPERDSFLETFGQLDPSFAREIRRVHPTLTDADIRLAAFIALGMDNKHIARVMAIRPESVKQARWRLRSKMRLSPGDSLEDAVRAFADNDTAD